MVARAEDVHVRARRVRLDEDELACRPSRRRRSRRARAATARRLERVAVRGALAGDETLLAEALLGEAHRHRDRRSRPTALASGSTSWGRARTRRPRSCRRTRGRRRSRRRRSSPYRQIRPLEPFSTSVASRITAGSTQPPVTEPATSPVAETASVAPGSRGAEPIRSITEPSATAVPSPVQRSRMGRMSFIERCVARKKNSAPTQTVLRRTTVCRTDWQGLHRMNAQAATLRLAVLPRAGLLTDALLVAGGAGLIAASAQVSFKLPFTPVPITGQTFSVLLVGAALGSARGGASALLYVLPASSASRSTPSTARLGRRSRAPPAATSSAIRSSRR